MKVGDGVSLSANPRDSILKRILDGVPVPVWYL